MGVSTIYDIGLEYRVKGNAASGLGEIASSAEKATKATDGLGATLGKIAGLAAGAFGIHEAKKAFIDFNGDVEQSQIGIATISKMFNPGQTFDGAMANAAGTFERYQQAAIASTATTKDFLNMHQLLAPTLARSGAEQAKIEEMVKGATIAAPILLPGVGMQNASSMLANDMRSMLEGTVNNKDHAAMTLLAAAGLDKETFNQKARGNMAYAMDFVQKSMNSPAIKAAAQAMEGSFEGVKSTLIDTFEILAGKAGQPLFKAITEEIKSWNKWLTDNKALVEDIKNKVAHGLVEGFKAVKDVVSFIIDHKDALMLIGGAFMMKGGFGVGAVGGLEGLPFFNGIAQASTGFINELGNMTAAVAKTAGGLALLYVAAKAFAEWVDSNHKKNVEGPITTFNLVRDRIDEIAKKPGMTVPMAGDIVQMLRSMHAFNEADRTLDPVALRKAVGVMGFTGIEFSKLAADAVDIYRRTYLPTGFGSGAMLLDPDADKRQQQPAKTKNAAPMNVTIQRIEVASDDPDRFVAGLSRAFDKARRTPGQARGAIAGGL